MVLIAKYIVLLFAAFLIGVGILMLFNPEKARSYLRKAGSTNLINYAEITVRMIPAAALILSAEISRYPDIFKVLGWFMIATSLVLYIVPRRIHHNYALKSSEILKPNYLRILSPCSIIFGCFLIYAVF